MSIDDLSRKAGLLYGYIQRCGGGALDEWQVRDKTGLSHGSICAAPKAAMIKSIPHEPPPQEAEMPRVAGMFNGFDDWLSTLTVELGGCVNVSESPRHAP